MKIFLQRSWNFYKPGYGTLSLFINLANRLPIQIILFHWISMPMSEVDFRFDILRKLRKHPSKDYITYCIFCIWSEYGPGLRLLKPTRLERLIGKYKVIRMRIANGEKMFARGQL